MEIPSNQGGVPVRVDEYTGFLAVLFIIRVFILYLYYFVLFLLSNEEVFRCVLCIIRIICLILYNTACIISWYKVGTSMYLWLCTYGFCSG